MQTKLFRLFPTFLFLAFFAAIIGCKNDRPEGMPALVPVVLTFTQEGVPCEKASVSLIPDESSRWPIGGSTDAQGKVELKTYGKFPGVPEGNYTVTVSKVEREVQQDAPAPKSQYDAKPEVNYNLIDVSYGAKATSKLRVEVQKGKKDYPVFELGPKIREKLKAPGE